jgi:hypothetical protein
MSVSLTEAAVVERRKTVTRRRGWKFLRPGEHDLAAERQPDQWLTRLAARLAEVEVVSVRREPLHAITPEDVEREGFPGWTIPRFIEYFLERMGGTSHTEVTRIEWRYLDEPA